MWMDEIKNAKDEFDKSAKRIIKTDISSNLETLNKNLQLLLKNHNEIIFIVKSIWNKINIADQLACEEVLKSVRAKTRKALQILEVDYKFSENLISPIENPAKIIIESSDKKLKMTPAELIKLASATLKSYAGEPSGLSAFLNSIELLETLADDQTPVLLKFIKTRLEGKALDAIPPEPQSIQQIKECIKTQIRPESSDLLEAQLSCITLARNNVEDFTKKVNDLADSLNRSLLMEGTSQIKAQSIVNKKVVEICRKNATSQTLNTIIAASTFQNHKEILAKFSLESTNEAKNSQILSFQRKRYTNRSSNNNNTRDNRNQNNRQFSRQYQNNPRNNNRQRNQQYRNNRYNTTYQNNNTQHRRNTGTNYIRQFQSENDHDLSARRTEV